MLDITKLLHEAIEFDWKIDETHDIQLGPEARLQNMFTALDVELAEIANCAEWFKVWKNHHGKQLPGKSYHETVLEEYVDALNFFLLFSAKKQWTHLIVLDQAMLDHVKGGRKVQKVSDWNQEYLAIKNFLYGSYFNNRQDDFRHAWHLFLKLGLVDLGFSEDEIMDAYEAKLKINIQRQVDKY